MPTERYRATNDSMETIHWVCAHGHHGAGDHLPEQCPLGWCQEQVHRTRPVPA